MSEFESRLTRFERAKIVAARYMMLLRGAPPLVETSGNEDLLEIAKRELYERKLPLTIIRLTNIKTPEGEFKKTRIPLSAIESIDFDEEVEL